MRESLSGGPSVHPSPNKAREEYHNVQNDLSLMRNRVNLLRQQLQKEKDSVKKHRNMTQQVVQKKAEISKVNSLVRSSQFRRIETTLSFNRERRISDNAIILTGRSTRRK